MIETVTAFVAHRLLAAGAPDSVALAVARVLREDPGAPVVIVQDRDGRSIDLDLRGEDAEIQARYAPAPRGPGRPKLGVAAREVTLLPRHWEWLARQPGGASVALRKLVEAAMRRPEERRRERRDATYAAMSVLAGDLPGFEAATRALYADDGEGWSILVRAWPDDVAAYLMRMREANAPESG